MKKILLLFLFLSFIYGGYLLWQKYSPIITGTPIQRDIQAAPSSVMIGEVTYQIEIADTDARRAAGLSGRTSLPANQGMLFLFDTKDRYTFWMRGMKISLDFIWINDDEIVDIDHNVPVPLTETIADRYQPQTPVNRVLEINAGEAKKNQFHIGQKVFMTLLKPESSP